MPIVHAGDLDVFYLDNGSGGRLGTIVFVHGNWATSSWWEQALGKLVNEARAVAYDVRGRGQTTGPDSDYSIPSLAADLGLLIAALGLETPHLVGHSLGSAIVMQYALTHPMQVRSVTVAGPAWVDGMPVTPDTLKIQQLLQQDEALFFDAMSSICPAMPSGPLWIRLRKEGHRQRWEATKGVVDALANWKPGDLLRTILCPKLVVGGENDPFVNAVMVAKAASALGALRVIMPGTDHGMIIEKTDVFLAYLTEFIRTVPPL